MRDGGPSLLFLCKRRHAEGGTLRHETDESRLVTRRRLPHTRAKIVPSVQWSYDWIEEASVGRESMLPSTLCPMLKAEVPAQGDPDTLEVVKPPQSTALDDVGPVSPVPPEALRCPARRFIMRCSNLIGQVKGVVLSLLPS